MTLRKEISKLGLLFAATGGIIGSGWLLGPYFTAQVAGPAAILSWLLGGLLMMVIAFTFAELSTTFPEAGGLVRFAQYSHGTFASFTIAWISWLAAVMVAPIETMAAVQYAANYIPELTYRAAHTIHLTHIGIAASGLLMLLMCTINCFSVRYFAKSNSVIVSWKLIIPLITIIILFTHRFTASNFVAHGGFIPNGFRGILTALPTAGVIFSFIGYSPAIQLAGEAKNPKKAVPIAIIGSITIAIVLYVLIETAFIGALNPADLVHGWSHLHYAGDSGPIAGLISAFGIVWFLVIIYADALISPAGTAFIYTASTSRINIAMSKNNHMPTWMQGLNRHAAPYKAIGFNFIVGMIFFMPFPGWQAMVSFIVSCFVIAYAIGPIACAHLRTSMPDVERPFRLPAYHTICLLAFYICNMVVFWTGWTVISKMLITMLIGYVVLGVRAYRKKMPLDLKRGFWLIPYLLGTAIISYLGSFGGGKNIIHFGWDFLIIAVFTVLIYRLGTKTQPHCHNSM
jgi:amino acid transporter